MSLKKNVKIASFAIGVVASSIAFAEPAVIIVGDTCGMLDGDGVFISTTDTKTVNTNSSNGRAMFKCHASDVPNSTGSAVHYDFESTEISCGILLTDGLVFTNDWKQVVDTEGNAVLTCKYKED